MNDEKPKPELMDREPVLIGAGITALAEAVIAALVIFGIVDWSAEQVAVLMGLVGAVLALAGGWLARGHVYTPAAVDESTEKAALDSVTQSELNQLDGEER